MQFQLDGSLCNGKDLFLGEAGEMLHHLFHFLYLLHNLSGAAVGILFIAQDDAGELVYYVLPGNGHGCPRHKPLVRQGRPVGHGFAQAPDAVDENVV